MDKSDIIKTAMEWSNEDPLLCAEMAVKLDRLYDKAYAEGFADAMRGQHKDQHQEPHP